MQIILRLPPYLPDLNVTEEVFPKVKSVLLLHNKLAPHSREALVEAIGLLPSVELLLGRRKNASITAATAH